MKLRFLSYLVISFLFIHSCQYMIGEDAVDESEQELPIMLIEEGRADNVQTGVFISEVELPESQSITSNIVYYDDDSYRIDWMLNQGSEDLLKFIIHNDTIQDANKAMITGLIIFSDKYQTKQKLQIGSSFQELKNAINDMVLLFNAFEGDMFCYSRSKDKIHYVLDANSLDNVQFVNNNESKYIEIDKN